MHHCDSVLGGTSGGKRLCAAHSLALFARVLLSPGPGAPSGGRRWSTLLPTSGVLAVQTGTPSGTHVQPWLVDSSRTTLARSRLTPPAEPPTRPRSFASSPAEQLAVVVLANRSSWDGGTGLHVDRVVEAVVDEFAPEIGERRKTWAPPPPFSATAPAPRTVEFVGTWVGAIDTYRGKRPLTLSIDLPARSPARSSEPNVAVRIAGGGTSSAETSRKKSTPGAI